MSTSVIIIERAFDIDYRRFALRNPIIAHRRAMDSRETNDILRIARVMITAAVVKHLMGSSCDLAKAVYRIAVSIRSVPIESL